MGQLGLARTASGNRTCRLAGAGGPGERAGRGRCGSLSAHTSARTRVDPPLGEAGDTVGGVSLAGSLPAPGSPRRRGAIASEEVGPRASPAASTREEDEAALTLGPPPRSSAPPPSVTSGRPEPRRKRANRAGSSRREVVAERCGWWGGGPCGGGGSGVARRAGSRGGLAPRPFEVAPPAVLLRFPGLAHPSTRFAGRGLSPPAPLLAAGRSFCGVVCLSPLVALRSAQSAVFTRGVCGKYRRSGCL